MIMEENGSACLTTELGCSGFGSIGMLLLSLGITVALVGSLFYYVRQRFEVLEVSHKEQIGVMQNFIASIGDQFQRMHSFIQQQSSTMFGGATKEYPPTAAAAATATAPQQPQQPQQSPPDRRIRVGSLIDVSDTDSTDDSEYSDYDDDSATSDTDAMEFRGAIKIHDELYVDNDDAREYAAAAGGAAETIVSETDPAFDIKIIELTHISPHPPCNRDDDSDDVDESDDDSDDNDDDESDDDDSDDDGDNGDDGDDMDRLDNHIINVVTVIKNDSTYCELDDKIGPADVGAGAACRSMVVDLDLDLGELLNDDSEPTKISPITPIIPIIGDTDDTILTSAGNKTYAHMSIKQLRKLVKIHNTEIQQDHDISKLKREQLLKILEANANFQ